ncbi:hypothetical protein CLOM_g4837, partial [Closterium sp. NIES-68]
MDMGSTVTTAITTTIMTSISIMGRDTRMGITITTTIPQPATRQRRPTSSAAQTGKCTTRTTGSRRTRTSRSTARGASRCARRPWGPRLLGARIYRWDWRTRGIRQDCAHAGIVPHIEGAVQPGGRDQRHLHPRRRRVPDQARRPLAARIRAVETGGCPHAAIREDISINLGPLEELSVQFTADMLLCESGGGELLCAKHAALSPPDRVRAEESGGCPHAAIREDISTNLGPLEELSA